MRLSVNIFVDYFIPNLYHSFCHSKLFRDRVKMGKKVTVKDVAREAGVSVATVSYIMNDRTDQKISPETKKKVLQIANLLNYRPSHAAKSLATGRNNIIGIAYFLKENSPSRNHEILRFFHLLTRRINRLNYDVIFMPLRDSGEEMTVTRNIDAIIAIDLDHATFRNLSDNYLVPVIAVDMQVNDGLFYQIYTDYRKLVADTVATVGPECYLLMDAFANDNLMKGITDAVPTGHVLLYTELTPESLSAFREKDCIILGSYLATLVQPYLTPEKMHVISSEESNRWLSDAVSLIHTDISKKANLTINILMNALDRNFEIEHDLPVV